MQFIKYLRIAPARSVSRLRLLFGSACLMIAASTGVAAAQSPVAYVYVGENGTQTPFSAVSAFAASSDGKLTQIKGSPFTQTENVGFMLGTNGTQFIFVGPQPSDPEGYMEYLYSYQAGSDGAIGQQVSALDTTTYSGAECPGIEPPAADIAVLDHTGQYVYVSYCGDAMQTYKINHPTGALTFQDTTTYTQSDSVDDPKIAGNNAYAYNMRLESLPNYGYGTGLNVFARESNGNLDYLGAASVTGPSLPENYYDSFDGFPGNYYYNVDYVIPPMTNDATNHFAVDLGIGKFTPPDTDSGVGCALASFTVGSNGDLTSTNTYADMPAVCASSMLLSPDGKFLVLLPGGGRSLQFFHFNGADPITPLTTVTGKSGWFTTMAWDSSNHLYVLNGLSGRLHVYTVNSSSVVEASGSPYDLPFCGYDDQDEVEGCMQNLVVRSIP